MEFCKTNVRMMFPVLELMCMSSVDSHGKNKIVSLSVSTGLTLIKVTPTTFWLICKIYPNALNFAPHEKWKMLLKILVF